MFPGMVAGGEYLRLLHLSFYSIDLNSIYSELFLGSLGNMERFQVDFFVTFHEET